MPRRRYTLIVSASLAVAAAAGAASVDAAAAAQIGLAVRGATSETRTSVPEPGSITLISAGLTLLLAATRRFMG
jgi:hypothetical protein